MTADPSPRAVELYQVLLAVDANDRQSYLDRECAGDPELLRQVESLLAAAAPSNSATSAVAHIDSTILQNDSFLGDVGPYFQHFRIGDRLGAGGMGQVYLATDTRLQRTVAIKVVSQHLRHGDSWSKRFLTEAQAISALNHPHICTLYDIGHDDNVDYLVMEYLDGETLADRLQRKALSLEEIIRVADQVASALHAAHSQGILHRDLKPGNIMLTDRGAKVLDFGLAKFTSSDAIRDSHESATGTVSETIPGLILGTVSYMSPEQARGETLDKQTDVWSFGCVLYEMLSRRRAFGGKTQSDCIAACLEREPDWNTLPNSTPNALRVLLKRCLVKDREFRLHDMADARIELRSALGQPSADREITDHGKLSGAISRPRAAMLALLALVSGAALTALGLWSVIPDYRSPPARPLRALSVMLPDTAPLVRERTLLSSTGRPSIALSPNGDRLMRSRDPRPWGRG